MTEKRKSVRIGGIEDPEYGLWEKLLKETATAAKLPDSKILVFGRPGIGKRSLLQALHSHACPDAASNDAAADHAPEGGHSRAVGLDYAHVGVRDPDSEEASMGHNFHCPSACSVLILEDVAFEKLLQSRLTPATLQHCAAIICLDLKTPWTMMEDLRKWLELLQRLASELMTQLPLSEQDALRDKTKEALNSYKEPAPVDSAGGENAENQAGSSYGPGGAGSLSYNMGIPVIVAVTRADTASALETQKTLGWSETIEAYLRHECLEFGAAIVYTTVQGKNIRNVDALYEYLMHRLYSYALNSPPRVPSRDALFVPSGWDSPERVNSTATALQGGGLDRSFESIIVSFEPPPPELPKPIECEDMQNLLKRSAAALQKMGAVSATGGKAKSGGLALGAAGLNAKKPGGTDISATGSGRRTSLEGAGKVGLKGDNASVANFFQNLLTRGSGPADKRESNASTATSPSGSAAVSAPASGGAEKTGSAGTPTAAATAAPATAAPAAAAAAAPAAPVATGAGYPTAAPAAEGTAAPSGAAQSTDAAPGSEPLSAAASPKATEAK